MKEIELKRGKLFFTPKDPEPAAFGQSIKECIK